MDGKNVVHGLARRGLVHLSQNKENRFGQQHVIS